MSRLHAIWTVSIQLGSGDKRNKTPDWKQHIGQIDNSGGSRIRRTVLLRKL